MRKIVKGAITGTTDKRLVMTTFGDTVLCRFPFPNTSKLIIGKVEKIKDDKLGRGYVKIKGCNKWFVNSSFYKLADK